MRNSSHIALLTITLTATACQLDAVEGPLTNDGTQGLPQGLSLFSTSEESGVSGMYAEGDVAVLFESVRAEAENPALAHTLFASDGTPIDVSARFVDMEGRDLMTAISGHLVPEEWNDSEEPSPEMAALRPQLFELAAKAAQALETADLDARVEPEREVLVHTARVLQPPDVDLPEASDRQFYSTGLNHSQYFEIHEADIDWFGIAEHSSFVFWNYSQTYGWEDGWMANNHGSYPYENGMRPKCGKWNGGGRPHYGSSKLVGCDRWTRYRACGVFGGNHNCHDDTKMQRAVISCGYSELDKPRICSDRGCDLGAPSCGGCY